jgi:hypothetical protein
LRSASCRAKSACVPPRDRLQEENEVSAHLIYSQSCHWIRLTHGVMGMLARFRDPSELPPGVAAAFVDPSLGLDAFPVLDCTSFRNCSLFIANQDLPAIESEA